MSKSLMTTGMLALALMSAPLIADAGPESKCAACHKFSDKNSVGPGLKGVFGRKAGTHPGFKYKFTKYIKGEPWVWDEEHLRAWIDNSKKALRKFTGNKRAKTKMPAQHVTGADADAVIAFLKGLN